MKALFDSSVLVAGILKLHVHHQRAVGWLQDSQTSKIKGVVATHTLAETYSVLTRIPRPLRVSPAVALQLIEYNIFNHHQIVALDNNDYTALIHHLAKQDLAGGVTYDAVIACAAVKANIDHIITINYRDFARIYPALTNKIIVP